MIRLGTNAMRILVMAVIAAALFACAEEKGPTTRVSETLGAEEPSFVAARSEPVGFALTTLPTSGVVVAGQRGIVCYSHNGDEQWRFEVPPGDEIIASPAIAPNSSVFLLTRQSLVAISASGEMRWTAPAEPADIPAVLALGDGTVVVTSGANALVNYGFAGRAQWRFELPDGDKIASQPTTSNNSQVFVQGAARIYVIDASGVPLWDKPL